MKVTRVHHVSINTNDATVDDVVDFYRGLFHLPDQPRPDIPGVPGHWHRVGDVELHIVGASAAGQGIDPVGHHFCFAVEDLVAATAELDERGIEHVGSADQVWFVDPAGNTIELQQEGAPS